MNAPQPSAEIELEGHLIDSLILPKVLSTIMDMDGDFDIIEFKVGRRKSDISHARLKVYASTDARLLSIIRELNTLGAVSPELEEVVLEPAPADRVAPRGFYSTTNHPTRVRVSGGWVDVEDISMDRLVVVRDGRAMCVPLSDIKRGDMVVVGERGVMVSPPERPRSRSIFGFMGGRVSSERPTTTIIRQIAEEMVHTKQEGGKIAVVGGPAIVHTGAAPSLAWLIREKYVDVLLAGNALAVHDIEYALYGTSLGMDINTSTPLTHGHRNHLYAINEVMAYGSIRAAVEGGLIKKGIMYECIKNNVPYVLAGSIRDDGPLPDVITDSVEAKRATERLVEQCEMVLMLSTMLHSIAVGNVLPSYVKTVCVDVSPATVTKLMDRGTAQAIGLVSDIGVFLPTLTEALREATLTEKP
ncbi:MAG: ornithine cyclodeaminase, nickel-pincer nucleotide-dependent [Methermicoccaceae archaeon]